MDSIRMYLADGTLPLDPKEADRMKKGANWFILYGEMLYKCSYAHPLLRCVTLEMDKRSLTKSTREFAAHILAGVHSQSLLSKLATSGPFYARVL